MYRKQTNPIRYFLVMVLVTSSISTVFATPDIPVYKVAESSPQRSFEEAVWNSYIAPPLAAKQELEINYFERPKAMTSIKDFKAIWGNAKKKYLRAIIDSNIDYSITETEGSKNTLFKLNFDIDMYQHKIIIPTDLTCKPERKTDSLSSIIKAFDLSLYDSANLLLAISEIGDALNDFTRQPDKSGNINTEHALKYIEAIKNKNNKLYVTVNNFILSLAEEDAANKLEKLNAINLDDLENYKYFARFIQVVKEHFTQNNENKMDILNLYTSLNNIENELLIQENHPTYMNGEIIWKITDFNRKRQQAISKEEIKLASPFLFTKEGYQIETFVYLNGDGIGEGTHLSVFFRLNNGSQDSLLTWPFYGWDIEFTLKNQLNKELDLSDNFTTNDKNADAYSKPLNKPNIASGCPVFVPLSKLEKQYGFVYEDSIVIKVSVVKNK